MRNRFPKLSFIILLVFLTYSCDFFAGLFGEEPTPEVIPEVIQGTDTDGDGIIDSEDDDIDGDNLSNSDEINIWKTNPVLADTDGDGWDDGTETNFGEAFSPLLANMPQIQLIITTGPSIVLNYEESAGTSSTYSLTESSSSTIEDTNTYSYSETTALENSWSVEVTGQVGTESYVSASAGYSGSYTSEDSWEWGSESTQSNTQSVEESNEYSSSHDITYTDGTLSLGVKLANPSDIAYTVNSLTISAYQRNESANGGYSTVGSMIMDGGFSPMTLSPGNESGDFALTKVLSVGSARALAASTPSLVFSLAGFNSSMTVDGNTKDFTQEMTEVAALCAKVIIDFGDTTTSEPDQYLVAARTKYNEDYTSSSDIYLPLYLSDILANMEFIENKDYIVATNGHIESFEEISENDSENKQWVIAVTDNNDDITYYSKESGYDLTAIEIKPGYSVNLFFSEDKDGDGLVLSMENIYGSSDEDSDTDGDSIEDLDEVMGWDHDNDSDTDNVFTHPALADTDGDGTSDAEDDDPTTAYLNSSAEIESVVITDYQDTEYTFQEDNSTYQGDEISSETAKITVTAKIDVSSMTLNNINMTKNAENDLVYTYQIASLKLGENSFTLKIVSEDESETMERTLLINSRLQDPDNLTLTEKGLGDTNASYLMDLGINWGAYSDSRAEGAVLLFKQGTPSSYQLPSTTFPPETIKDESSVDANTYSSGETAVKRWETSGITSLGTDYFGASYYNQNYSFRVAVYGQNDGEDQYYYSSGETNTSFTTPNPDEITITKIKTEIEWSYTSGAEDDPEFVINENLTTAEGSFIQDLATRTDDNPWKGADEDYLFTHTVDENFTLPSNMTDEIFQITYDIDEDDPLGEHNFVDSKREIQFNGKSGDSLYSMNDEGKYSGSKEIDTETYYDNDKGEITMTWTVYYNTSSVE